MWRSEPQMPLASIATIASSRAASSGSGFSSTRTSPGARNVTALIRRPSCRVGVVFEESGAGLAAETAAEPERAERRGRSVALLAPLLVQRVENHQNVVEADLVRPREWAARVVEAVDHAGVDVGGRADALAERERALVDHLADHPAEHEAGRVTDPRGVLAEACEQPLRRRGGRVGGGAAACELDQLRSVQRWEHVESDRAAARVERSE